MTRNQHLLFVGARDRHHDVLVHIRRILVGINRVGKHLRRCISVETSRRRGRAHGAGLFGDAAREGALLAEGRVLVGTTGGAF